MGLPRSMFLAAAMLIVPLCVQAKGPATSRYWRAPVADAFTNLGRTVVRGGVRIRKAATDGCLGQSYRSHKPDEILADVFGSGRSVRQGNRVLWKPKNGPGKRAKTRLLGTFVEKQGQTLFVPNTSARRESKQKIGELLLQEMNRRTPSTWSYSGATLGRKSVERSKEQVQGEPVFQSERFTPLFDRPRAMFGGDKPVLPMLLWGKNRPKALMEALAPARGRRGSGMPRTGDLAVAITAAALGAGNIDTDRAASISWTSRKTSSGQHLSKTYKVRHRLVFDGEVARHTQEIFNSKAGQKEVRPSQKRNARVRERKRMKQGRVPGYEHTVARGLLGIPTRSSDLPPGQGLGEVFGAGRMQLRKKSTTGSQQVEWVSRSGTQVLGTIKGRTFNPSPSARRAAGRHLGRTFAKAFYNNNSFYGAGRRTSPIPIVCEGANSCEALPGKELRAYISNSSFVRVPREHKVTTEIKDIKNLPAMVRATIPKGEQKRVLRWSTGVIPVGGSGGMTTARLPANLKAEHVVTLTRDKIEHSYKISDRVDGAKLGAMITPALYGKPTAEIFEPRRGHPGRVPLNSVGRRNDPVGRGAEVTYAYFSGVSMQYDTHKLPRAIQRFLRKSGQDQLSFAWKSTAVPVKKADGSIELRKLPGGMFARNVIWTVEGKLHHGYDIPDLSYRSSP